MADRSIEGSRVGKEEVCSMNWLRMSQLTYKDPVGKERTWDMVERTTRREEIDAVAVFALLESSTMGPKTILVRQYRPPLDKICVELPAGLVEKGEKPEQAAIRELKEETGYSGVVHKVTCMMYNDPGITNANMRMVLVKVNLDLEENKNPTPHCDPGEFVETIIVPIDGLCDQLK
eukprot:Ihof_evm9s39 gene=Ihof_evmTU9s39